MTPLHTANVAIHIVAAAVALLVGLVSLFGAKRGAAHRRAGKFVLPAAITVAVTAVIGMVVDPLRPALTAITHRPPISP